MLFDFEAPPTTKMSTSTYDDEFALFLSAAVLDDQIKKDRMEEKLRLARLSQRLRFQDEGRGRLSHLYKKILTALHRQRRVSFLQ